MKGISRSAAVVTGFLMEEMNLNYDTALRYVRTNRPKVNPNRGFQEQLILWWSLRYNICDETGKEKPEYVTWKAENEEKLKLKAPQAGQVQQPTNPSSIDNLQLQR
jgi:protein-tyrosine phosphatase